MPELTTEVAGAAAGGPAPTPSVAPVRRAPAGAVVSGLGVAVPEQVVPNEPIANRLGVDSEWIATRTGVRERRVAEEGELVYAYAARAGFAALSAAGLDPLELDLVVVATMSHEQLTPSAAALVAAEIGAERAAAVDVNAACNGFIAGLSVAVAQVESGRASQVLLVGADLMSRLIDRDDRGTAGLFADGAGAVVLSAVAPPGRVGPLLQGADGRNAHLVQASREEAILRMKGHDTFRHAVDRLSEVTAWALDAAGLGAADVDLFVYHQANSRILRAVGERLGLPAERVVDCVPRYGNTSAASIPIALAEAEREGQLRDGAKVLLAAFGGGLTWGACTLEWGRGDAA